jgi:hypothetical protein
MGRPQAKAKAKTTGKKRVAAELAYNSINKSAYT